MPRLEIYQNFPILSVLRNREQVTDMISMSFSQAAANKAKVLIDEEQNANLKLRVLVTGGGCSGFEYGFTFDEDREDDDSAIEQNGVMLLIDPLSYQYLAGAEIDFREDLQGSRFIVTNPNASATCGCGNSFSV